MSRVFKYVLFNNYFVPLNSIFVSRTTMLRQSQQQRLLQKLSPQQIQLMKLLQVPTAHLEERIKEELEENPALETGDDGHEDTFEETKEEFESAEDEFEKDGSEDDYGNIDISEYVSEGDDD